MFLKFRSMDALSSSFFSKLITTRCDSTETYPVKQAWEAEVLSSPKPVVENMTEPDYFHATSDVQIGELALAFDIDWWLLYSQWLVFLWSKISLYL